MPYLTYQTFLLSVICQQIKIIVSLCSFGPLNTRWNWNFCDLCSFSLRSRYLRTIKQILSQQAFHSTVQPFHAHAGNGTVKLDSRSKWTSIFNCITSPSPPQPLGPLNLPPRDSGSGNNSYCHLQRNTACTYTLPAPRWRSLDLLPLSQARLSWAGTSTAPSPRNVADCHLSTSLGHPTEINLIHWNSL